MSPHPLRMSTRGDLQPPKFRSEAHDARRRTRLRDPMVVCPHRGRFSSAQRSPVVERCRCDGCSARLSGERVRRGAVQSPRPMIVGRDRSMVVSVAGFLRAQRMCSRRTQAIVVPRLPDRCLRERPNWNDWSEGVGISRVAPGRGVSRGVRRLRRFADRRSRQVRRGCRRRCSRAESPGEFFA